MQKGTTRRAFGVLGAGKEREKSFAGFLRSFHFLNSESGFWAGIMICRVGILGGLRPSQIRPKRKDRV
jgi:hypothetical protein